MQQRVAALAALAGLLILGALLWGGLVGAADTAPGRISFQIATGFTTGSFFPVGQAIAGLISHPPGVGRCDTATVCGPNGLIVSARTSEGAAANLRMVNDGQVDSGLVQGDVIAAAAQGKGPFRRSGPQRHVRVIAALFQEQVHLVAAAGSNIHSVADLRGKRIAFGSEGTGAAITAREVLAAYGVAERAVRQIRSDDTSDQLMQDGKVDAFFAVASVPLDGVKRLIAAKRAYLVPIDGPGRARLIQMVPALALSVIPGGGYPDIANVETVATRAYWITRDSASDALIYGITRALFNPANRALLSAAGPSAYEIDLSTAAVNPPAPLHSGAARFYREAGKL